MPLFEKEKETLPRDLINRLNQHNRRLRVLEQSKSSLVERVESLNKTLTENFKEIKKSFREIQEELDRIDENLQTKEKEINLLKKEVKTKADQTELKKIDEYIDLIDPLRQEFVKREDVQKIVKKMLR